MASKTTTLCLFASFLACSAVRQVVQDAKLQAELEDEATGNCPRWCGTLHPSELPDANPDETYDQALQRVLDARCTSPSYNACSKCKGNKKKGQWVPCCSPTVDECREKRESNEVQTPDEVDNQVPEVKEHVDNLVNDDNGIQDEDEDIVKPVITDPMPVITDPKPVVLDVCTKGDTFCATQNGGKASSCKKVGEGRLCDAPLDIPCSCEDDSVNEEVASMVKGKCKRGCTAIHGLDAFSGSMAENQVTLNKYCKSDRRNCGGCKGKRGKTVAPCCSGACLRKALDPDSGEDIQVDDKPQDNNGVEDQDVDEGEGEEEDITDTKIDLIADDRVADNGVVDQEEEIVTPTKNNACSGITQLEAALAKALSGTRQYKRTASVGAVADNANALQDALDTFAAKSKADGGKFGKDNCDVSKSKWGKEDYYTRTHGYTKAPKLMAQLVECCAKLPNA